MNRRERRREKKLRKLPSGSKVFNRALEDKIKIANAYHERGYLWDAVTRYREIVKLDDDVAVVHSNMGAALAGLGEFDKAAKALVRALQIDPVYSDAMINLGTVRFHQENFSEAIDWFEKALEFNRQSFQLYNNLGNAKARTGKPQEAEDNYRKALSIDPNSAEVLHNLGCVCHERMNLSEAECYFRKAISISPSFAKAHWNLANTLLMAGKFEEGWEEFVWRWKCDDFRGTVPVDKVREWKGEPLEGKTILVRTEQGHGDAIQFVRFLANLKRRGAIVFLLCPSELAKLLETEGSADEVNYIPKFSSQADFQTTLMELPRILGLKAEEFMVQFPYLRVPTGNSIQFVKDERISIGLVWRGRSTHPNDKNRSIGLESIRPLIDRQDVRFISLQLPPINQEILKAGFNGQIEEIGSKLKDFTATAAVISDLDLVLSVDTAVAHLAGAQGKKVWVLLPYCPDWRWLEHGSRSIWYPEMRLFRQSKLGEWGEVISQVKCALHRFIAEKADKALLEK